jgi:hypothetical protein
METVINISIRVNPRFAFEFILMVFLGWLIKLDCRLG